MKGIKVMENVEKMNKRDFLLCMDIHKLLKAHIKGRVFISFYMGTLSVHINAGRGIKYFRNINERITKYNFEKIADQIEYDYRHYIRNVFFQ